MDELKKMNELKTSFLVIFSSFKQSLNAVSGMSRLIFVKYLASDNNSQIEGSKLTMNLCVSGWRISMEDCMEALTESTARHLINYIITYK